MNKDDLVANIVNALCLAAAPGKTQLSMFPPFTCRPDEIALTFDETECRVEANLSFVTDSQLAIVRKIGALYGQLESCEWTEEAVLTSEKWESIRKIAMQGLDEIGVAYMEPSTSHISYVPYSPNEDTII